MASSLTTNTSFVKNPFSIENLLAKPYKNGDFVTLTRENIQIFNDFQNNNEINDDKRDSLKSETIKKMENGSDEKILIKSQGTVKFDYGPRMHTPDSSCTDENMDMGSDTALDDSNGSK